MALRIALVLTLLVACAGDGEDGSSLVDDGVTACDTLDVATAGEDCTISLTDCEDGRLHELLCKEYDNGDGTYDERLICDCAEDQAVHGATILEGEDCGSIDESPATIEAGFRACGRELSAP